MIEEFLDTLGNHEGVLSYLILTLSAAFEYIFPPFPGDTVTLFGAFLVTARGWNIFLVLGSVTFGSLLGAVVDYYIGIGLTREDRKPPKTWFGRYWERMLGKVEPLVGRLKKRGASYIVVNRFLPGIRAFFFVAAGMARLPLRSVLFYALISALLWNLLIVGAGVAVGASWDRLKELAELYSTFAWSLVGLVLLVLIVRYLLRKSRSD